MIRSSLSVSSKRVPSNAAFLNSKYTAHQRWAKYQLRSKISAASMRPPSPPPNATPGVTDRNKMTTANHLKNQRQRRKQHQLVVSSNQTPSVSVLNHHNYSPNRCNKDHTWGEEEERIEAIQLFLGSLQLATVNTTLSSMTSLKAIESNMRQQLAKNHSSEKIPRENVVLPKMKALSVLAEQVDEKEIDFFPATNGEENILKSIASDESPTDGASDEQNINRVPAVNRPSEFDRLNSDLHHAISRKNVRESIRIFRRSQIKKITLPSSIISRLLRLVSETDPLSAHSILQYYNSQYLHSRVGDDGRESSSAGSITKNNLSMYRQFVKSIERLDPRQHSAEQSRMIVESLLKEIEEMDISHKRVLYPSLLISLMTQRIATVGSYAYGIYESIIDNPDFEVKAPMLRKLLSMSRYNRQDDIPFHDVMARLAQFPGNNLAPHAVLPAIQNMFPFTNTEAICMALRAWLDDFHKKHQCDSSELPQLDPKSLIDLSTLESISVGASQAGSSELIHLVWDVLEACRYNYTETIYENTIVAFAKKKGTIQQAFAVMAAMKEDGFEPSRPLIRSVSSAIRLHKYRIGETRRILIEDHQNEMAQLENQCLLSMESLNAVISSYAERGDPTDAVEILELMVDNDIEPNADSYSFVIEALGRDIKKRMKTKNEDYLQRNMSIANTVLSMMEERGIEPNTHVIRNYIELLSFAGEIETATNIIEDYLLSDDKNVRNTVNNITIYRVAIDQAKVGNFRTAYSLAKKMTEHNPSLYRRVRNMKQRAPYHK